MLNFVLLQKINVFYFVTGHCKLFRLQAKLQTEQFLFSYFARLTATAQATVAPTIGLLPL